ncbi:hypothetical protein E2C01_064265 [Portunus trituberculatus]|uniref:Uncharacterized protein n=1 Tax=Portunus trituberculatus TaxID=210409 RepID=A0A5B7HCJ9_PORTR|nr:hypothetical protein [Portunus trituberculatus]
MTTVTQVQTPTPNNDYLRKLPTHLASSSGEPVMEDAGTTSSSLAAAASPSCCSEPKGSRRDHAEVNICSHRFNVGNSSC